MKALAASCRLSVSADLLSRFFSVAALFSARDVTLSDFFLAQDGSLQVWRSHAIEYSVNLQPPAHQFDT